MSNGCFIPSWETRDLLFAVSNFFLVFLCNHTKQNIFRSVHSQHHRVPNNHTITKWHPFKFSKFINKSSKIWKAVLTISNHHDICHFKAAMSNFTLAPPMHTLSRIPICCHAPTTHFPACSLVLKFSNSLGIHHDYLLFNILHLLISHTSRW